MPCYYSNKKIPSGDQSTMQVEVCLQQKEDIHKQREALGLVWATEKFHMYLFGNEFELVTDHKPLEVIYSAKSKPSARIERWD